MGKSHHNPPKSTHQHSHRTKHSGIYLPANATFLLESELLNELPTERDVYLGITYEFIPSKPSSFKSLIPVFLEYPPLPSPSPISFPPFPNNTH